MYAIAKLDQKAQEFLSASASVDCKTRLHTLCLARALASQFPVPPAGVLDTVVYFASQFQTGLLMCLNDINEIMPIDIDGVTQATKNYWFWRNRVANPIGVSLLFPANAGTGAFFESHKFFSEDDTRVLNEAPAHVLQALMNNYFYMTSCLLNTKSQFFGE